MAEFSDVSADAWKFNGLRPPIKGHAAFLDSGCPCGHKDAGRVRLGDAKASRRAPGDHHNNRLQEARRGLSSEPGDRTRGKKMFAVFKTGGKQYRVTAEDVLKIDKVAGEPGSIVEFAEVLVVGGDKVALGTPTVAGATVAAEVLDQGRGPKIIAFKKRRRKNSRRKRGHRQEFTLLRITEILTDGRKPSAVPPSRRVAAAAPTDTAASASAGTG
jgi:large subunit ribosomal protein L21